MSRDGDGFNERDAASLGIGFIPGFGEGKSFIEIFTGRDLISDRPVSKGEAIFGAIPVLGKLKKVALVGGFVGGGINIVNRADDAADMVRAGKGTGKAPRMTTKEAKAAAKELGYQPTNYVTKSGEKVFYNKKTKTYISQDVGSGNGMGSHNGGVWKAAKSPEALNSKDTRLGTYDANLNRIGD